MIPAGCLQPCWESLAIDFSLCLSVSLIQREQMKIAKSLRSAPLRKLRKRSWENGSVQQVTCVFTFVLLLLLTTMYFFVVLVLVMDVVVGWCILIHFFSSKHVSASKKKLFYSNYVIKETDPSPVVEYSESLFCRVECQKRQWILLLLFTVIIYVQ